MLLQEASFKKPFYSAEKNNIFEKRNSGAIQGETSPPATSTETGTAHILGTATDNNEDRD